MQDIQRCVQTVDKDYIIRLRRELHMHPELGFDLPKTIALVKGELDSMSIPYTEKYGRSSVVATINGNCKGFTIGIRADMDALPIIETNDIPYKSKILGRMHACGHDAHTAMLLGTAKALKSVENELACRVKLIFQPSEEGEDSGAKYMVEDGVMDDIDIIIGLHVENWLESCNIGVCPGVSMAASRPVTIEFFGKSAHATLPQSGHDALAMAIKTYNDIQILLPREMDPFVQYVCSVGSLHSGTAHNIIADYAVLEISMRTYDTKIDEHIFKQISRLSHQAADMFGGKVKVEGGLKAYPIINDPVISQKVIDSATKVVGSERIAKMPKKMSSEDFSFYLTKKPGVFFRLGTRNSEKGYVTLPHNNDFMIDEEALPFGSKVCVQFIIDNMFGIKP